LSQAAAYYSKKGRNLDAARAATALAAATEQVDPENADAAAADAEKYFAAAGDALGPASVKLARALADARSKRLETALQRFADAAEAAEKVGGGRATALARAARDDAAATLVMLGHDADLAKLSAEKGLGDLVKRQQDLAAASSAYDGGLIAYNAGSFADAEKAFTDSRTRFEALGESEYAMRARRSAAWAAYNGLVGMAAEKAAPRWQTLVVETGHVEDPELYARAYGASVILDHQGGKKDVAARLEECVRVATKAGVDDVAARCHGAIAERDGDLGVRADHARDAFRLDPRGSAGIYALYCVAVDAHNAGEERLALDLARLARPNAGKLGSAVDEVIAAAGG
jgi:hypothetical protein